jgi:uncharacterized protein
MQKKEALIIFARAPEKGKVKTRLAVSIGENAALTVYEALLQHTQAVTKNLTCDKYVFYASHIPKQDLWDNGYSKESQQGENLGDRMKNALHLLFQQGYLRVVLIGSDCFELTEAILKKAFSHLDKSEMVIGPAQDGGYYLIGMKDDLKDVFEGMEWSTENVWQQTKEQILAQGYTYHLLPVLNDVDTLDDLPSELLPHLQVK